MSEQRGATATVVPLFDLDSEKERYISVAVGVKARGFPRTGDRREGIKVCVQCARSTHASRGANWVRLRKFRRL